MLKNYYKVCISGKNIRRFIKMLHRLNISLISLKIDNNCCHILVDENNYKKLIDVKTSYKIEIENIYGIKHIKKLFKYNSIFLLFSFLGLILIFILSNIIFDVEIMHSDSSIRSLLETELKSYNIKKYSFVKSYSDIQEIKNNIIENNKNNIEWIEIERVGSKYIVRVEKRIKNEEKEKSDIRHVVAKKSGIILKIVARDGEIVKKVNDYVLAGDIIISGEIHKGEDVLDNVSADGDVYAEVWYKVRVTLPINYYEKKYTGLDKNVINIEFINNNYNLFDVNPYKNKEVESINLFSDFFNLFKINYNEERETIIIDEVNLMINDDVAVNLAKRKIAERLSKGEYIISQKKLKTILNNSTINVEVFFKVYENISSYKYYKEGVIENESTIQ